jgi:hypothetical protein
MMLRGETEGSGTPGVLSRCKRASIGKLAAKAAGVCLVAALLFGLLVGLAVASSTKAGNSGNNLSKFAQNGSWKPHAIRTLTSAVVGKLSCSAVSDQSMLQGC